MGHSEFGVGAEHDGEVHRRPDSAGMPGSPSDWDTTLDPGYSTQSAADIGRPLEPELPDSREKVRAGDNQADGRPEVTPPEPPSEYGPGLVANRDISQVEAAFRSDAAELADRVRDLEAIIVDLKRDSGQPDLGPVLADDEIDAAEDQRFHALYLAEQLHDLEQGPGGQPAALAASITTAMAAYQADVEANRARFPGKCWDRIWTAAEKKMPWLLAALAVKTEVKEWSAAGTLGVPGFMQGTFTVTFGAVRE